MPYTISTNNKPAARNRRAVDTAQNSLASVIPIANDQYHNAFKIVGFPIVVYNKLKAGRKCSCHSSESIGGVLDGNGNLDESAINELLTASPNSVQKYGYRDSQRVSGSASNDHPSSYSKLAPQFDNISTDVDDTLSNWIESDETTWGSKGLVKPDLVTDDTPGEGIFGLSTTSSCPICFGTGFVGGFSTTDSTRIIVDSTYPNLNLAGSALDLTNYPNTIELNEYLSFECTLPKGAVAVDAFKVWNLSENVTGECQFETLVGSSWVALTSILDYCLGKPLTFRVSGVNVLSHIEIQLQVSTNDVLVELPRLQDTGNSESIDRTGDISVNITPKLPALSAFDCIADGKNGKIWVVKDCTFWNDNNIKNLGWDANLRVSQPMEIFAILPIRRPTIARNEQHRFIQNLSSNRV